MSAFDDALTALQGASPLQPRNRQAMRPRLGSMAQRIPGSPGRCAGRAHANAGPDSRRGATGGRASLPTPAKQVIEGGPTRLASSGSRSWPSIVGWKRSGST